MSRRINSFGYRLGITHFWKFQRGSSVLHNTYFNLAKVNLCQMVTTLFSFFGYKLLLCVMDDKKNSILVNVSLLSFYSFSEEKKNSSLFSKKNTLKLNLSKTLKQNLVLKVFLENSLRTKLLFSMFFSLLLSIYTFLMKVIFLWNILLKKKNYKLYNKFRNIFF